MNTSNCVDILPIIESDTWIKPSRRAFFSMVSSIALGILSDDISAQGVSEDRIQDTLNRLIQQYPWLKQVNQTYDEKMKQKIESWKQLDDSQGNSRFALGENMDEIRIMQKYGNIISILCRNLDLDSSMMTRLILLESQWKNWAESFRGAQWLMQLMPDTAQDFAIRYQMYQSIFGRISPSIVKYLTSPIARDAMKILAQGNRFSTSVRLPYLRAGERVVRRMIYELYNPEVNLIFWHTYFSGLRSQLEPKMREYQIDLSHYFSTLSPEQYQRIIAWRRSIGAREISIEYLRWVYAERLRHDTQFALDTETLVQYNSGINRPKQSYNYAAIIQI